ncbi:MAG: SUMF1/EgtB/PvdO family nonheme iron enzyme [Candidatus Latescibacteria bacterium]|nr:SUMF1/EgtB/PvdO family nonheme iron enzyme [Candidatus Latescibacterota bacterium]
MKKIFLIFVGTLSVLQLFDSLAFSAVTGQVEDIFGYPVSEAVVTFTDVSDSNILYRAITDSDGMYEIDFTTFVNETTGIEPKNFTLKQNYPNPFNPSTTIPFTLYKDGFVNISIYNVLGQKVNTLINEHLSTGPHSVAWASTDDSGMRVSAGIYIYQFTFERRIETKKMLLLDGGSTRDHGSGSIYSGGSHSRVDDAISKIAGSMKYDISITGDGLLPLEYKEVNILDGQTFNISVSQLSKIPEGNFSMGSSTYYEQPVHEVSLDAFEMSVTEVTQHQYETIMGTNPSWTLIGSTLPVDNVNWYDAVMFCNRLSVIAGLEQCYDESTWECNFSKNGFRLPTEAEWEYACRAGTTTEYYTGNTNSNLKSAGWFYDNGKQKTHPVGEKVPNKLGLYDMHGNVWEWCNDRYGSNYYSESPEHNPPGPDTAPWRVIRGGGWVSRDYQCRSACRDLSPPEASGRDLGFRVVIRTQQ